MKAAQTHRANLLIALLLIAVATSPLSAPAAVIVISPEASGQIGGEYFPLQNAFDNQPLTLPTVNGAVIPGWVEAGNNAPYYPDRWGYIDFGENWPSLRIAAAWTGYRPWSSDATSTPYQEVFWSYHISTDPTGTTPENNINFLTTASVAHVDANLWYQDWAAADESAYITPSGRYLILHSPDVMTNRAAEYVLLGYWAVPEPGSAGLLLLGTTSLLLLRRKQSGSGHA